MSSPRIKLVLQGPWGSRVYVGEGCDVSVGRGKGNTLPIPDDKASRVHCRITRDADGFHIRDTDSSNGTFVNGMATRESPLVSGDRVEIGETTLRFEVLEEERPGPPGTPSGGAGRDGNQGEESVLPRRIQKRIERLQGLENQVENLKSLLEINRDLLSELNRDKLLELIIDTAIRLTRAERGFLILFREDRMVFEVARNFRLEEVSRPEYEVSRSIAGDVARDGRSLITANAEEDDRFQSVRSVARLKLRSIMCVPLSPGSPDPAGQGAGALYFDNRFEEGLFTDEDLFLLEAFAAQASLALKNAGLFSELERSRDEIVELNRALEGKVETQQVELDKVRRVLETQQNTLTFRYNYSHIVGRSQAMARILKILDRITATDLPVLVEGDSGTGKELIARAIHFNGPRSSRPFISENCAAIPAGLFESELFGYVRGAFTGADQDREGLIELAHEGTLFLDEVGDLDLDMQKKLLRVLQEGEVRRVGDKKVRKVDVRIVSATNQNLERMIRERKFRQDFYYRLCGVSLRMPPLRERAEDIPLLVDHFLKAFARNEEGPGRDIPARDIDAGALKALTAYAWPGNVRELENELHKAWHLTEGTITVEDLSPAVQKGGGGILVEEDRQRPLREVVDRVERQLLREALDRFKGNKSRVARALGLSRVGLRKKMARLGLMGPETGSSVG